MLPRGGGKRRACSQGPAVHVNRTNPRSFGNKRKSVRAHPLRGTAVRGSPGLRGAPGGSAGARPWPFTPEPRAPQTRLAHPHVRLVASPIPTRPCRLALPLSASAQPRAPHLPPRRPSSWQAGFGALLWSALRIPGCGGGASGRLCALWSQTRFPVWLPQGQSSAGSRATLTHSRRLLKVRGMNK